MFMFHSPLPTPKHSFRATRYVSANARLLTLNQWFFIPLWLRNRNGERTPKLHLSPFTFDSKLSGRRLGGGWYKAKQPNRKNWNSWRSEEAAMAFWSFDISHSAEFLPQPYLCHVCWSSWRVGALWCFHGYFFCICHGFQFIGESMLIIYKPFVFLYLCWFVGNLLLLALFVFL